MKNMIEAFISPQPPTQPRDLEHINRTFLMKVWPLLEMRLLGIMIIDWNRRNHILFDPNPLA